MAEQMSIGPLQRMWNVKEMFNEQIVESEIFENFDGILHFTSTKSTSVHFEKIHLIQMNFLYLYKKRIFRAFIEFCVITLRMHFESQYLLNLWHSEKALNFLFRSLIRLRAYTFNEEIIYAKRNA